MTSSTSTESALNSDIDIKNDNWSSPEHDNILNGSSLDLISSDNSSELIPDIKKRRFSIVEALEAEVTSSRRSSICFHDSYFAREGDILIRSVSEIGTFNPSNETIDNFNSPYFSPELKKENYVSFPGTIMEQGNISPRQLSGISGRRFTWACPPSFNGNINSEDDNFDNDNILQFCNQLDSDHKIEQEKLQRAAQLLLPLDKERDLSGDIESSLVPKLFSDKRHSMASSSADNQNGFSEREKKDSNLFCCPWPCCERVFSRFYNLRSHYRIHSGEKPFSCEFCDLSFARNHDLKRHERIHSQKKAFECSRCHKGFSRNDAMSRHIRLNTCKKYHSSFMNSLEDDSHTISLITDMSSPPEKTEFDS